MNEIVLMLATFVAGCVLGWIAALIWRALGRADRYTAEGDHDS